MNLFSPLPAWPFGDLKPHYYNLLAVDPPWNFELYSEEGNEKSASAQYACMSLEDIQALPVGELADVDCLLLLWATAPMLPEAIDTMRVWGFTYRSWLHWRKLTKNGKAAMGTGYRVRTMGELCLVGTIGNPRHKPFYGDLPGERREHSRKPESFYSAIDRACGGLRRRADIFSRQSRPGWVTWGHEATKFDQVAA